MVFPTQLNDGLPLLVIVGPTAVGKTDLSLRLAKRFNGEIISADSRLFYKGLDIGTAKPTRAERQLVPHHLIDVCEPGETITLGEFKDRALAAIAACHKRSRLPILVGGTGQYVMALVEGWGIPRVAPQPALRRILGELGKEELIRWLKELDPAKAEKIDYRNVRRMIRALEVTLIAGRPISELQRKHLPPFNIQMIGLHRSRETLYQRIDERVDLMLAKGLIDEIQALLDAGFSWSLPSLSGLGYRQLQPFFEGNQTLKEASARIKFETHRFVRHQYNWFRLDDERIQWFDADNPQHHDQVISSVTSWLKTAK